MEPVSNFTRSKVLMERFFPNLRPIVEREANAGNDNNREEDDQGDLSSVDSESSDDSIADPEPEENMAAQPAAAAGVNVPGAVIEADLVAALDEINGQDFYDAKVEAVGKLSRAKYLQVPNGLAPYVVAPDVVGSGPNAVTINNREFAAIYAMNKGCFDRDEHKVRGALLRACLVKAGWYTSNYEVTQVAVPADAVQTFNGDSAEIRELMPQAVALALLLPLAMEHTFRTMGHHYLTALAAEYEAKYNAFFAACVKPTLTSYLPPAILYHEVAHWVPLTQALTVVRAEGNKLRLPNAVVVRSEAAPAGTALITTSAAILQALEGTGLKDALAVASKLDIDNIVNMATTVKRNPGKYHTIPSAYGFPALNDADKASLELAKDEARKLAPVLQGFLDSLPRQSDLQRAKALAKHADVNPLLRRRAKTFFKEIGTTKASTMAELFSMDKRAAEATSGTEVVEDEDEM